MSIPKLYETYRYKQNVPERGLLVNGRPALTGIDPADIGDAVILTVRDPLCAYDDDPAAQFARHLDDAMLVARTGMFTTWTGRYKGVRISIVSGGSGSPEAELVLHEFLENTAATTYLRVGGSGGIGPQVRPGDLVISSGVVRDEGMTQAYVPASYPAVASYEVVMALIEAAEELGVPFHVGLTRSSDSDFCGVGRPGVGGYMQPWNMEVMEVFARAGVLNGDRESAAAVLLPTLFGRRGGSICSVADNIVTGETFAAGAGHDVAIRVALEGLTLLHQMDQEKATAGRRFWIPAVALPRNPDADHAQA